MGLLERYYPGGAAEVERRGLERSERLIPPLPLSPQERAVAVRVVWATGDPTLAPLLRFHPRALEAGREALTRGAPLIVDTRTTEAGLNLSLLERVGSPLTCLSTLPGPQSPRGPTRLSDAVHRVRERLTGAVVAIGTAPSALLALLDLVDQGEVRPALIVGTPVGLVASAQAKEELTRRPIPFITLVGERGGGAVASTIVNALLLLTLEQT